MHIILTVIKKELVDTLRDKKTLFSAIILPALAIPLLLLMVTNMEKTLMEKETTKHLTIALVNPPHQLSKNLEDESYTLLKDVDLEAAKDSVAKGKYDAVLEFEEDFDAKVDSLQTGNLKMYYKSTNMMVKKRLKDKLDFYSDMVLYQRMRDRNIPQEMLKPIAVENVNIASAKEQVGKAVGGFIPYIFILFCFMGCMYPALDLITGEKERGTIETLLTVPASRFKILMGKTITIALVGVVAAAMTIGGMVIGLNFIEGIPPDFLSSISDMISFKFIIMLFAMLLPLSLFFAGVLSAVVVRTSSFKEAQSYVTPMTFVVIIPAMVALMPGVELSWSNAFIPILNVALATKEIIAGTIDIAQYISIVLSLIGFATLAVYISYKQFSQEGNVLK